MGSIGIQASSALLSALSISNLGLISSMVGFLHKQKYEVITYQVDWPDKVVSLKVLPQHLWLDQGHTSNGSAGYGFFLGLFGLIVAWRLKKRQSIMPSKFLLALLILQLLAILFTLSAIIFVFTVTNATMSQHIVSTFAESNLSYTTDKWTPETWFKAVLELPLADQQERDNISRNVTNMVAWKWMLIPIFSVDVIAFAITTKEYLRQRKDHREPEFVSGKVESVH